jgi:hypothetical protein
MVLHCRLSSIGAAKEIKYKKGFWYTKTIEGKKPYAVGLYSISVCVSTLSRVPHISLGRYLA